MLEFQNPSAWVGLLAIPGAILILLWRRRPVEVAVPSVLHWKVLPQEEEEGARRFRLEGLRSIALVAAAIAALVAAAAGPEVTLSKGGGRARIVIDRSASMQAVSGGRSRLDLARQAAISLVEGWGAGVEVRVDALPAGASVAGLTPSEAAGAIAEITPSILPLDPERLLPEILPPPERREQVFLFTDRIPTWDPGGEVAVHSVGGPTGNLGITEFEVGSERVFVSVGNFTGRDREVPVRLEGSSSSEGEIKLEETISIPAGEEEIWIVPTPPLKQVRVRLLTEDAFPLDDEVQATLPDRRRARCALVGGPCPSVERALEAIPRVELVRPAGGEGAGEGTFLSVYYQRLPTGTPRGPLVLIDPPADWGGLRLGPAIPDTRGLLSPGPAWEDLSLSGVRLETARQLRPEGIEPILQSLPSGRTVAGTIPGSGWRALALAFDPEEGNTNWPDRVSFPVFWSKVVEWAGLPPGGATILRGGEPIRFRIDFPPARLVGPTGEELARFETLRTGSWLPESPGVYQVEDQAGRRPFSVNLLSREESRNAGRPRDLPPEDHRIRGEEARRVAGWPLLVCLFVLLTGMGWLREREGRAR